MDLRYTSLALINLLAGAFLVTATAPRRSQCSVAMPGF
jgi:hypothetical protein